MADRFYKFTADGLALGSSGVLVASNIGHAERRAKKVLEANKLPTKELQIDEVKPDENGVLDFWNGDY